MKSIRARLMVLLLTTYLVSWLLVVVAVYIESTHEVEEVFDAELAQTAAFLAELATRTVDPSISTEHQLEREVYGHRYEKKIAFQIWQHDRLVMRSANAPQVAMSGQPGFSDQKLEHQRWRVFMLESPGDNRVIYVGERYDVRDELTQEITANSLYPMIAALPVIGVLLWFGIARGLAPVRRVAQAVSARSPQNLDPINDTARIPSEIRPLVRSLNELFQRLAWAFERERRFTGDAAHELRTPLASIKTQSQVALRAQGEEERRHALKQIEAGVSRTTRLVEQLLTLARLDPDAASQQRETVDLQQIAAETLAEISPLALEKGIELSLDADTPVRSSGYPTALGVMTSNLVRNAIQYTPAGGQVMVAVATNELGQPCLNVTDTGPGIPEEERPRVFDRFYRGTGQHTAIGSGLGLSIARRIAELHGAEIELLAAPGGQHSRK